MKILYTILLAFIIFTMNACNKETATTQTDVMNSMLANKNWYLDYSITGTSTKSYVGQSTYFVTYLKDGTTKMMSNKVDKIILYVITSFNKIDNESLERLKNICHLTLVFQHRGNYLKNMSKKIK